MHFFYQTNVINLRGQPTPIVPAWDLSGYSQVALHMWIQGPAGATVSPLLYFDGMWAAGETLTTSAGGPPNVAILAKVYSVFAPTLSVVLYPSAAMQFQMRVYAACCGTSTATPLAIQRKRVLKKSIPMDALIHGPLPRIGT